jgi:secreted trypsin-like serine protease
MFKTLFLLCASLHVAKGEQQLRSLSNPKSVKSERVELMIGGDIVASEQPGLEFIVALMWCYVGGTGCSERCTGSLISPNMVLTAAHCVRPNFVPFGSTQLTMDIQTLFVLVDSVNYMDGVRSRSSELVPVESVTFGSYGTNIVFPYDGDIALIRIGKCFPNIQYARLATRDTEPLAGACTNLTVAGFGRVSNAPDAVRDYDGTLRLLVVKQHSPSTCKSAYEAISYGQLTSSPDRSTYDFRTSNAFVPDSFICTGGTSPSNVCHGDSGGPTFTLLSDGRPQVIGVTSFIFYPGFCSIGPSYATRVSFHLDWIYGVLTKESQCSNYSLADSFATSHWENAQRSPEYIKSRCDQQSQWQCGSFECIDKSQVCDGHSDCQDGSDENFSTNGISLCSNGRSLSSNSVSSDCQSALTNLDSAISDAKSQWTVGDIWDTSLSQSACSQVTANCPPGSIPQYCSQLSSFLYWNATIMAFAESFGDRFNASCPDDKYLGWTRSASNPPPQSSLAPSAILLETTIFAVIIIQLLVN